MIKPETTVEEFLAEYNMDLDTLLDFLESNKSVNTTGEALGEFEDVELGAAPHIDAVAKMYIKILKRG